MKYLTGNEIRDLWLKFWQSKGHSVEESASLIPYNDNTLLWINAGVAPLKKYFDGRERPKNPRITNAQKCIRTNDIDNVGRTARHHTFFEMLGNFSIGDYFKNEVIPWAFELLTSKEWFDFDPDKLYVTVYPDDELAKELWIKAGIDESHIVPVEDNFWCIGDGPSGPDTEIFYDRGEKYNKLGIELLQNDIENDRFIEIWNIVFSQYNADMKVPRSQYKELPSKNIDTGCGLERLACVIQGVDTNYDSDLFTPYIKEVEKISGIKYEGQMAFKVIADHVRTVTFALADGANFSNEGRGYVLRRVLRRAVKYARKLHITKPFMKDLAYKVMEEMEGYYPYLREKIDMVSTLIEKEEIRFLDTISNGEKKIADIISKSNSKIISGKDAFMLFDTFGFPIELTEEYASESGFSVDLEGFKAEMDAQKERARASRNSKASFASQNEEYLKFKEKSLFIGYDKLETKAKVIKVFKEGIVLDETPFYAFSGGQLADKGTINDIEVMDVIKMPNGEHLHLMETESFKEGDEVYAHIDEEYRDKIKKNHSSAHLFQAALQALISKDSHQQGSQMSPNYMRFDFNLYNSLTDEDLLKIEEKVNEYIKESHPIVTHILPLEEAKKLGAMALFGEKYGDVVRVVDMDVSKEFCGGTHETNTANLGHFAIMSYESIGSGIYRVEGITGNNYMDYVKASTKGIQKEIDAIIDKANKIIEKAKTEDIKLDFNYSINYDGILGYKYVLQKRNEFQIAQEEVKKLEKEYNRQKENKALHDLSGYLQYLDGDKLVFGVDNIDINLVKQMADNLLSRLTSSTVAIIINSSDKTSFVVKTNKEGIHAGNVVKQIATFTKGSGGGRADMAQGGTKELVELDKLIEYIKEIL